MTGGEGGIVARLDAAYRHMEIYRSADDFIDLIDKSYPAISRVLRAARPLLDRIGEHDCDDHGIGLDLDTAIGEMHLALQALDNPAKAGESNPT